MAVRQGPMVRIDAEGPRTPTQVRRLTNLGVLALYQGYVPFIPALTVEMPRLLAQRSGVDLPGVVAEAPPSWAWIITEGPGEATGDASTIMAPWTYWRQRLHMAELWHLDDFHPRRPMLDRWVGDEDGPTVVDWHLRWPKYDLDGALALEENVGPDIGGSILASAFLAFWRDLVAVVPDLRTHPPAALAHALRTVIEAHAAAEASRTALPEFDL